MDKIQRSTGVQSPALGVGPSYRPAAEKPTATVSREVPHENVHVLPQTPQLIALLTYVRSFLKTYIEF